MLRILCIYGIADVWSLFALVWVSLNCLVFLNVILCSFVCFLNLHFVMSLEMLFVANLVVQFSLLCLRVGNFKFAAIKSAQRLF